MINPDNQKKLELAHDISRMKCLINSSIKRELEQKKQIILGTRIVIKEFVFGCQHEWDIHNFGFICSKCRFYTGMNVALNKNIENLNRLNNELSLCKNQ